MHVVGQVHHPPARIRAALVQIGRMPVWMCCDFQQLGDDRSLLALWEGQKLTVYRVRQVEFHRDTLGALGAVNVLAGIIQQGSGLGIWGCAAVPPTGSESPPIRAGYG